MTQDEIIALLEKAKLGATGNFGFLVFKAVGLKELTEFANLVAAKEREKCAFLCHELWRKGGWDYNAGYAATRIRARGEA